MNNKLPEGNFPVTVIDTVIKTAVDRGILDSWMKFLTGKGYRLEITKRDKNTILRRSLSETEKAEILDGTDWKFSDDSFQYQHGV